jgi:site-specific DNA-methyltransferase (adenine-specific)
LVAASRLGRRYVGYDLDPTYVDLARTRVATEGSPATAPATKTPVSLEVPGLPGAEDLAARKLAERVITEAGFTVTGTSRKIRGSGVTVDLVATDATGVTWLFDMAGSFTSQRGGLSRTDTVWRHLGRAAALRGATSGPPLVMLTTRLPAHRSEADQALRAAGPSTVHDVVDVLDADARGRLSTYATGSQQPAVGFWTDADVVDNH